MSKLKIIIPIILLIFICSTFYFYLNKKSNTNELTLYGNIEIRQVDLSFQVSGQISKMLKEEGDSVKKGELIATLDNRDYVANLDKATAQVEKTKALKLEKEQIFNKNNALVNDGAVSKQTYDTSKNMFDKLDIFRQSANSRQKVLSQVN